MARRKAQAQETQADPARARPPRAGRNRSHDRTNGQTPTRGQEAGAAPERRPDAPERRRSAFSTAMVDRKITLQSGEAQRQFDRFFQRLELSLFLADVICYRTLNERAFDELQGSVAEHIRSARQELVKTRDAMEKLLAADGADGDIRFSEPKEVLATVRTPSAFAAVDLLVLYDSIIVTINKGWFSGSISHGQKETGTRQSTIALSTLSYNVTQVVKRAREAARIEGRSEEVREAVREAMAATGGPTKKAGNGQDGAAASERPAEAAATVTNGDASEAATASAPIATEQAAGNGNASPSPAEDNSKEEKAPAAPNGAATDQAGSLWSRMTRTTESPNNAGD